MRRARGRVARGALESEIGARLRDVPAWVDGVAAIAMFSDSPAYFTRIEWDGDRIAHIRDYRHVPTIADGARFTPEVAAS